jgi:prephenate dehydratase/prephenate dehydrogenase
MARPTNLLVMGAAAGIGRWLCDHLFADLPWDRVFLVDTEASEELLAAQKFAFAAPTARAVVPGLRSLTSTPVDLSVPNLAVCLAVPAENLGEALTALDGVLDQTAVVFDTSPIKRVSTEVIASKCGERAVFGIHALFDATARSLDGQTVFVVPSERPEYPDAHAWLVDAITAAGGIVKFGTAEKHDETMSYVQTMAHQSLLALVDAVTASGLDLEKDLWEARTPLFESLLGLAVRVISGRQQSTIVGIQMSNDAERVTEELEAARARFEAALHEHTPEALDTYIAGVRERFSGALFDAILGTAAAGVTAAQAKRAELARRRRTGDLVGLRPVARPDTIRVGRIVDVSPVDVTLEELMIGTAGHAVLLDGPGAANAKRLGQGGKPRRTRFGLGHIDLVVGDDLDHALDAWLGHVARDVRFLVPESVAGAGVLSIVEDLAGVRDARILSEVVRTGQRAVAIRIAVRADHDVDDTVELARQRVQVAYAWPRGTSLPVADETIRELAYLGPPGTFSESAARHCAENLGLPVDSLAARDDFPAVLEHVRRGHLAVLPISSSASGLVSRSAEALLQHDGELVVAGVFDVMVRVDAYILPEHHLGDLRGVNIFSHPQALAQCTKFIERWNLGRVPCESTVAALERVAQSHEPAIALAGPDQGTAYGLKVAERDVDDLSGSITRFLLLGPPDSFGAATGGSDPTVRSIWIGRSARAALATLADGGPAFDEFLVDPEGRCLWVTSRELGAGEFAGGRSLGRAPWSPRTPVVRVDV